MSVLEDQQRLQIRIIASGNNCTDSDNSQYRLHLIRLQSACVERELELSLKSLAKILQY
jgi:hypothetical protein